MEKYRNSTTCRLELLEDPALKTTATNYDFKYVPGEQFQRVIRTVQRDRLKQKKDSVWTEFCNIRKHSSGLSEDDDDVAVKPHRDPRNVIKTKTSTIKILSQPIVEKNTGGSDSPKPEESYRTYRVPKVRIMTDEEIKNVVENAFKEVIEKSSGAPAISKLLTSRQDSKNPDSETAGDHQEESRLETNRQESKEQIELTTNREIKQDTKNPTNRPETVVKEISPRWVLVNDEEETDRLSKSTNQEISVINTSSQSDTDDSANDSAPASDHSNRSRASKKSKRSIGSKLSKHETKSSQESNSNSETSSEREEETPPEPNKKETTLEFIPGLNGLEREELRKFLGVEEFIVNPIIDLNRFDPKSSSSSEGEEDDEEVAGTNIQPMVRIRKPTPRHIEIEQRTLSPIKPTILESIESPQSEESPQPKKTANLLKPPSERRHLTIITPRMRAFRSSMSTQSSPEKPATTTPAKPKSNPPMKSSLKSPIKSPTKILKNPPIESTTSVTPSRLKKIKSPKSESELKQDNIAILSKITSHQMKIIQAIEQIRTTLDNIPEPDGNLDLKRRQKRCEEFTARFGRNYLYQIGRWMEEIRVIPKEQCLARNDNEFAVKVSNLYGLLSQAIQAYLKHMNSFIVDRNPKKLSEIVDAISESTKMCIHKRVFDKTDDIILSVLRKTKDLKSYLAENREFVVEVQQQKPKKLKNAKIQKVPDNKWDASREAKKLSMYDSIPPAIATGTKRKASGLKGTVRSKTSIRSLVPKSAYDSKISLHKVEKKSSMQRQSISKLQNRRAPFMLTEDTYNDESFRIETPRIDDVNTHIENVGNDDGQDTSTNLLTRNLVDMIENVEEREEEVDNIVGNSQQCEEKAVDIDNTVIEALESITKQQVQQLLGPLMSNLGVLIGDQTGSGAGINVNALLSSLTTSVTSHLMNNAPSTSTGETFNRQDENTAVHGDNAKTTYDSAATFERELGLAPNRLQQQHQQTQAAAAAGKFDGAVFPAPNAFGELSGSGDDGVDLMMASSSPGPGIPTIPTIVRPSSSCMLVNRISGDSEAFGPTRMKDYHYQGQRIAVGFPDRGGRTGANSTDVETQKVQKLRYDRNVQFTFVTSTEDSNPEAIKSKMAGSENLGNSVTISKEDYKRKKIGDLCRDRLDFFRQITDSPLYVNEYFREPWKVVTKIANDIVDDTIADVEKTINFGEETFIRDFIQMELES